MLRVQKRSEPPCLKAAWRDYAGLFGAIDAGAWESLDGRCKDEIREAARKDQYGLRAYCTSRLPGNGTKLEHFAPRRVDGAKTLDWQNLLAVCPGVVTGHGESAGQQHCDTARGKAPLSYFPPDVEELFRYDTRGHMRSDDPRAEEDVETLKLNLALLQRNRRAVLDEVRQRLQRDDSAGALARYYREWSQPDTRGFRLPYAGVALVYLRRKFRSRGMPVPP